MAFCTTPVCFASSTSVASRACAAGERPFGSAAATRTVPKAPGTILAPARASAAGYPTPETAPKTFLCLSAEGRLHRRNGRAQRDTDDLSGLDLPRQHAVGGSAADRANLHPCLVDGGDIGKFCFRRGDIDEADAQRFAVNPPCRRGQGRAARWQCPIHPCRSFLDRHPGSDTSPVRRPRRASVRRNPRRLRHAPSTVMAIMPTRSFPPGAISEAGDVCPNAAPDKPPTIQQSIEEAVPCAVSSRKEQGAHSTGQRLEINQY